MREIEFRVWIETARKMFDKAGVINKAIFVDMGEGYEEVSNYKDAKLMQFTGILDKDKKKIFEGDIVILNRYLGTSIIPHLSGYDEHVEHFDSEIYNVVFQDGAFLLKSNVHRAISISTGEMLEVVGNTCENDFDMMEMEHNNPEDFYDKFGFPENNVKA